MDIAESRIPRDPYNIAAAELMRARKSELRLTFDELGAASGIAVRRLKGLINAQAPMHLGDFILLSKALELDPKDVVLRIL